MNVMHADRPHVQFVPFQPVREGDENSAPERVLPEALIPFLTRARIAAHPHYPSPEERLDLGDRDTGGAFPQVARIPVEFDFSHLIFNLGLEYHIT
jgi:hypothetical protein